MNACTHTHTHLTHMLDINIYVGVVEAKQGKELRECQGRGGNCSLIKSSQITFEQTLKRKKIGYQTQTTENLGEIHFRS